MNIYEAGTTIHCLERIEKIKADTVPQWGKMNAGQMLAHLNVAYDITYGKVKPKFNFISKFFLKLFVKPIVAGSKPYKKNGSTAPIFKIDGDRNFEEEKAKLIEYIKKTQELGADYFENRDYPSFGKMTSGEYSTLFYKHLNHHLTQFGV